MPHEDENANPEDMAGETAAQACVKEGHAPGSDEFKACVLEKEKQMAEHGGSNHDTCKARGLEPGTPDFMKCMRELQKEGEHGDETKEEDEEMAGDKDSSYPYPTVHPSPGTSGGRRVTCRGQLAPAGVGPQGQFSHPVPSWAHSEFTPDEAVSHCNFKGDCAIAPNSSFADAKKCAKECSYAEEYGCPVYFEGIKPMKYGELNGVEIFATGVHRNKKFTADEIDEIVANFPKFKAIVQPPMVLGHDENQEILQNSGLPALGWAQKIYRDGEKLRGDFSDVPDVVKLAIQKKRYKRISAEIYPNFEEGGKGHGLMLRRVGLLGADIPEVKNLADVVALDEHTGELFMAFSEGDGNMPAPTKTTNKADDARFAALEERLRKSEKQNEELSGEVVKSNREKEENRVAAFCDKLKTDGKYLPAWDEAGMQKFICSLPVERVIKYSEEEKHTPRDFMLKFLEKLPAVIDLAETAPQDLNRIREEKAQDGTTSNNALDREAKKLMAESAKTDSPLKYIEAIKIAGREHPELVQ